ncbi:MAG: glycosyltransferase [Bryobacterales bacterium]|nr:glycosyltransferase [Bryobacterales bacterium]
MIPKVSVLVATYNRPQSLERLLAALAEQSLLREEFEVVVVDDGSPQPVEPIARRFADRLQLTLHRQENGGPSAARNAALALGRGRFAVAIDDDCEPAPDFLAVIVKTLEAHPDAMVGGYTENGLPDNLYSTVSQMIVDRVYAVHNLHPLKAGFFTAGNFAVNREELLRFGAFNTRYHYAGGEDRGLCDQWRNSGHAMIYVPKARIMHFHNLTLRKFLRQHFNYGRGAIVYHRTRLTTHAEEARTARAIVFDFHAWAEAIRLQRGLHHPISIVCLLFLWQIANAAGYFWEVAVRRTRLAATMNGEKSNSGK